MFEWLFGKKDEVKLQPHPIEVRTGNDREKKRNVERVRRLKLALAKASGDYKKQIEDELKVRENA